MAGILFVIFAAFAVNKVLQYRECIKAVGLSSGPMRPDILRPMVTLTLWIASLSPLVAQPATFQFVSIRPPTPPDPTIPYEPDKGWRPVSFSPDGRFEARNVSLMDLTRVAYGFEHADPRHYVRTAAGRWTNNARYDVTAVSSRPWSPVAPGESLPPELRPLLQTLLEDRFGLKVGFETRRAPVVALRLVEPGKPGPMLRHTSADCPVPELNPQAGAPKGKGPCASVLDRDRIEAPAYTLKEFAELLSTAYIADRPIVDDTRLEGRFDIVVTTGLPAMSSGTPGPRDIQAGARYPSVLRDAMKTQLGLELRSAKLPVRTLLIERATRPVLD